MFELRLSLFHAFTDRKTVARILEYWTVHSPAFLCPLYSHADWKWHSSRLDALR